MGDVPHNLPLQSTSFVGRETEIADVTGLLQNARCRLLTLIGPGGVGKTRLALEAASRIVGRERGAAQAIAYPDGVYLIPLQSVALPEDIVAATAGAVGFEIHTARSPRTQLVDHLAARRLLLILDNYEHLLPATDLIAELLAEAPGVGLLVTSRTTLNLAQEWLYHLEGLAYPLEKPVEPLQRYSAVGLFIARARQMRHDFALEDEGVHVIEICRKIDGLPLGVELAASWLRRLSCAEIAMEIQRGLDLLESDLAGWPHRHRSMRAVLSRSWDLLGPEGREALMQLSVFRGGFRRESAKHVAGVSLPTLSTLIDHSLLRLTSAGRYEMHELQWEFAAEKLAERPELERVVRDRHCDFFAGFMDQPLLACSAREAKRRRRGWKPTSITCA